MTVHSLWLTQVDANRRVNAVRGIRAAIKALGGPVDEEDTPRGSIRAATELLAAVMENDVPAMIGTSLDTDAIDTAHKALVSESDGAATGAVDLTAEQALTWEPPDEADDSNPSDEREVFAAEVYQTAMVLLVTGDGNPAAALAAAQSLRRSTGDESFYVEVAKALLDVFPPPPGMRIEVA